MIRPGPSASSSPRITVCAVGLARQRLFQQSCVRAGVDRDDVAALLRQPQPACERPWPRAARHKATLGRKHFP